MQGLITTILRSCVVRTLAVRVLVAAFLMFLILSGSGVGTSAANNPTPVFAYYYIWFTPGSWDRAKTDYPLLGRYSSDDPEIMREHIRLAQRAGIDGFIVSWKSTDVLNARLEQLITIAEEEDFKLAIIYQGLDFERNPLTVEQIASDLDAFIERFAASPAFDMYARPIVIWSGTWEFSADAVEEVAVPRREYLMILASERNVPGYERLRPAVEGNAYYWSSVDPGTYSGYQEKLDAMSAAVHETGGFWIAPAAPGFDARLLGGAKVVERQAGRTLRKQFDTAARSNPDMIGLISWNEFSENSHIEPSVTYRATALRVVAEIQGASVPDVPFFASDDIAESDEGVNILPINEPRLLMLGLIGGIAGGSLIVVARRGARYDHEP